MQVRTACDDLLGQELAVEGCISSFSLRFPIESERHRQLCSKVSWQRSVLIVLHMFESIFRACRDPCSTRILPLWRYGQSRWLRSIFGGQRPSFDGKRRMSWLQRGRPPVSHFDAFIPSSYQAAMLCLLLLQPPLFSADLGIGSFGEDPISEALCKGQTMGCPKQAFLWLSIIDHRGVLMSPPRRISHVVRGTLGSGWSEGNVVLISGTECSGNLSFGLRRLSVLRRCMTLMPYTTLLKARRQTCRGSLKVLEDPWRSPL